MTQEVLREIIHSHKEKGGYTYRLMSEKSGVPIPTIQNFVHGKRNTSIEVMEKILGVFGLELSVRRAKNDEGRTD